MTLTAIIAALGGISGIVGAIYGIFKWVTWKTYVSPAQTDAGIDSSVAQASQQTQETGRPN